MNWHLIGSILLMMVLAFAQNISFSLVSRSRNRNNMTYHIIASILSNGVWFATFHYLVTQNMTWVLMLPYTVATVGGSVFGVKISMFIEQLLGATSDDHIKSKPVAVIPPSVPLRTPEEIRLLDKKSDLLKLSTREVATYSHIIVADGGICLCGSYNGQPVHCSDIIKAAIGKT